MMHIHPHSQARNQGRGEASPALFENRKNCLDFGKKGPGCVNLWVKFFIQNVVLSMSRKKNSKMFASGNSFSCVFDEKFMEVYEKFYKPFIKNIQSSDIFSTLFFFRNMSAYSIMLSIFKAYSRSETLLRQFRAMCNPPISTTLSYSGL